MTKGLYSKIAELSTLNEPFVVATVVKITGSASAKPGSKALIDAQGKVLMGWIGGGCAESTVRGEAIESLKDGKTRIVPLDLDDEVLGVGMPCGGSMEVYIEPNLPKPELLIVGHGRIAESLAILGQFLSFSVTVNSNMATREFFPSVDHLITDDLNFSRMNVTPNSYVVVVTQHRGDHFYIKNALEGKGAYIALVASKKRSGLVFEYLLDLGVSPEDLCRVHSPAGFDIGGILPEEIALSIMSEIVAIRRGGSGRAMMDVKGINISEMSSKVESSIKI